VRIDAQGGRSYQAWIGKLDNTNGALQLNWQLGLPPVLYTLSSNQFATIGTAFTLTAQVSNIVDASVLQPPPGLDWYFNGTHVVSVPGLGITTTTLSGSGQSMITSTLTISNLNTVNAGQYTVVATNNIGTTSAVTRLEVHAPAASRTLNSGDNGVELFANDSSQACPASQATYQWNHNGVALQGETNRSLFLQNVRASQAGVYAVTVTNCFGATTYTNTIVAVTVDVGFVLLRASNGQALLSWRATPGRHYSVQFRSSIASTLWTNLPAAQNLTTSGTSLSVTDAIVTTPRFYRVVLVDP
jgi:hypothetical protein